MTFYLCDITSKSAIHETAEAIRRDLGYPSILINNAGLAKPQTLLRADEGFLDRIFQVNVISHFVLIKEFLPAMLEGRKGHIVSIASVGSYMSGPPLVDYCATKAGVLALHEGMVFALHRYGQRTLTRKIGLKAELRQHHAPNGKCVQATVVHPGIHGTGMLQELQATFKASGGHVMPASNVANAVVNQVLSGRGSHIFIPKYSVLVSFIRVMPTWMQELMRDWGVGSN